jgi:osmoprotectant transport system ATP-binding protein
MPPAPAIRFEDVTCSRSGRVVLNRVTLDVAEGEVLAVVGRSGAGKSTLLKLINRLLVVEEGRVFVQGKAIAEWPSIALRRRIGYVLQEVGLFPHLSVGDNIAIVPRLERWPEPRIADRVREMLALVSLPPGEYLARSPDSLSGGQRQRVGVARALAADPPILLMDEPFGALDPITRFELHREFRSIQARVRKTILIVTHDMGEAFALADRVAVLAEGRIAACAPPREIRESRDPAVRVFVDAFTESRG